MAAPEAGLRNEITPLRGNNNSSLWCWVIWNTNATALPNLVEGQLKLRVETKKHPSPVVKPTNQLGSLTLLSNILERGSGITWLKAVF